MIAVLQYGLTPPYHPGNNFSHPPAFMHTNLAKLHSDLTVENAFTHVKRPRLNGINETALIRTPSRYNSPCFDYDQLGSDGSTPRSAKSFGDGQGVDIVALADEFTNSASDVRGLVGLVNNTAAFVKTQGR